MVQWVALLHHSKKVLGLNLSVWSLRGLHVPAWFALVSSHSFCTKLRRSQSSEMLFPKFSSLHCMPRDAL